MTITTKLIGSGFVRTAPAKKSDFRFSVSKGSKYQHSYSTKCTLKLFDYLTDEDIKTFLDPNSKIYASGQVYFLSHGSSFLDSRNTSITRLTCTPNARDQVNTNSYLTVHSNYSKIYPPFSEDDVMTYNLGGYLYFGDEKSSCYYLQKEDFNFEIGVTGNNLQERNFDINTGCIVATTRDINDIDESIFSKIGFGLSYQIWANTIN